MLITVENLAYNRNKYFSNQQKKTKLEVRWNKFEDLGTTMPIELNHTIAWCSDKKISSNFLAGILGLPKPREFYHFLVVDLSNGVSIDYFETTEPIAIQHYAFLVSEAEFDECFGRIYDAGLEFWADPARSKPGEINTNDGGRGVYFLDPDGHMLELITRPYGS